MLSNKDRFYSFFNTSKYGSCILCTSHKWRLFNIVSNVLDADPNRIRLYLHLGRKCVWYVLVSVLVPYAQLATTGIVMEPCICKRPSAGSAEINPSGAYCVHDRRRYTLQTGLFHSFFCLTSIGIVMVLPY